MGAACGNRTHDLRITRSFKTPRSPALLPVHLLRCLSSPRGLPGLFLLWGGLSADRTRSPMLKVGRTAPDEGSRTRARSSTLTGRAPYQPGSEYRPVLVEDPLVATSCVRAIAMEWAGCITTGSGTANHCRPNKIPGGDTLPTQTH